jgi:ribulose-5-phosphate 4-epimerase/fuculose-1-phosphate aldolase
MAKMDAARIADATARALSRTAIPTLLPKALDPPPAERSFEEERLYRKQRLAVGFRLFAKYGFDMGVSGHITARDPEWPDHFWVNPLARHFAQIRVSDLLLVNHEGHVVEGDAPVNRAAFAIHSALHAARPDLIAAAHAHSLYGKVWSAVGRQVEPLTQDAAIFYEDHAVFDAYSGVVDDADEGRRIAAALGTRHALILANHGILTAGRSVESAVWRYLALENSCKVQVIAQQAGGGKPMPEDVARRTHLQVGSEGAGIYSYEPYWNLIIAEQPDVLG